MFNAAAKIPMQSLILFIGAMVYVFYIYQTPPILFERRDLARIQAPAVRQAYEVVNRRFQAAHDDPRSAADAVVSARSHPGSDLDGARAAYRSAQRRFEAARHDGAALVESSGGGKPNDTNYIFLTFVTRHLPAGVVGLVIAMILGAAMSSFAWGLYAVVSALFIRHMGSLVEAVNLLGSFFYGGMLGVFVLAVAFPCVEGRGAFWGVVAGEAAIFACWYYTNIAFFLVQRHRLSLRGHDRSGRHRAGPATWRRRPPGYLKVPSCHSVDAPLQPE